MSQSLSILMAQINPAVGAIDANKSKIIDIIKKHQLNHDIIVFPELVLTGYPPEDLLLRDELFLQVEEALKAIQFCTTNCHVIIGHPIMENGNRYNGASIFANNTKIAVYHKQHLPNYGVFDEKRYFTKGIASPCVFSIKNQRIGLCICEDLWLKGPVEQLVDANINLMISINASPFDYNKYSLRESLLKDHAKKGLNIVYVNQIGGQDELVFDGQSLAMNKAGKICARAPAFREHLQTITFNNNNFESEITPLSPHLPLIYNALLCGLKNYVEKNKFKGVLLGLSGGIDSALTLCLAVDALGAKNVNAVFMPSRYSQDISANDAKLQAETMQVNFSILPIEPIFESFLNTLAPSFKGLKPDITEENLQARIRGVLLMALSNKTKSMLLCTSNKSETAVGYSTLYGDMAGGFSVLKDVLKTLVYDLAVYRNSISLVIPERVITRAPTAELRHNQKDEDSLPPYSILDAIIKAFMEDEMSATEIINSGQKEEDVMRVINLIKQNEYKRHQSAPGVKITSCAFGKDWRFPITSGFKS